MLICLTAQKGNKFLLNTDHIQSCFVDEFDPSTVRIYMEGDDDNSYVVRESLQQIYEASRGQQTVI